jgi:FtsH-binding integral membrane protein
LLFRYGVDCPETIMVSADQEFRWRINVPGTDSDDTRLFLGGFLSSAISILMWFSLFNLFFQSRGFYNVELYTGLLVFIGFIIYDTQMIIERVEMGMRDRVGDAANLFSNVVSIFVRLLVILMKQSASREEQEEKRRRRR